MEIDHAGNPCCGEDFMAGTICSLPPGHPGPHGTDCQTCGGDWMNETCTCGKSICIECGDLYLDDDGWGNHCWACTCMETGFRDGAEIQCYAADGHDGPHQLTVDGQDLMPTTDEDIQAAIASIEKDMPAFVGVFKTCVDCGASVLSTMGGDPPTCKTHN